MTQINWQYQVNNRAGGYIVTSTDWNDLFSTQAQGASIGDLLVEQLPSGTLAAKAQGLLDQFAGGLSVVQSTAGAKDPGAIPLGRRRASCAEPWRLPPRERVGGGRPSCAGGHVR